MKRWDGKLCVPTEKSWLRPCNTFDSDQVRHLFLAPYDEFPRLSRLGSNHYSIPYNLSVNLTDFCHNQYINHAHDHTYHWVLSYSITTLNWHLKLSIMFYLVFHSCPFPESVMFPSLALNCLLQTIFDILRYRKIDHLPSYSSPFIERLSRPHYFSPIHWLNKLPFHKHFTNFLPEYTVWYLSKQRSFLIA